MRKSEIAAQIIEEVCELREVSVEDVLSPTRKREVVVARQCAMWLLRNHEVKFSLNEIGKQFGGRHHTTVLHSLDEVDDQLHVRNRDYSWVKSFAFRKRKGKLVRITFLVNEEIVPECIQACERAIEIISTNKF